MVLISVLHHPAHLMPPDVSAQSDAAGTWGCAAVMGSRWLQHKNGRALVSRLRN